METVTMTQTSRHPVPFFVKLVVVVLIGVSLFWIARKYRGSVIAATVNKTPILRYQLNQTLEKRYGKDELENMVNEELLKQLAQREDIVVSADDIKKERDVLVAQVGDEQSLQSALQQYGMSEDDLARQIRIKLFQDRLAVKLFSAEISDDEAQKFFTDNQVLYEGKMFADVVADIKDQLKQQNLQQQFSDWFQAERTKASIQTYI